MPTLLFRSPSDPAERWADALRREVPDLEVRVWPETGCIEDIDYALVWASPDGFLRELPALRVVFSLGAGVDHLVDGELPCGIPLVRMVDPALTEGMVEFVLYQVLRHHRHMPAYERQQAVAEWRTHEQLRPGERRVGILGLGELGGACARALAGLGFDVAGFARSPRQIDGVRCFHGEEGFSAILARSDILVCLLPLTQSTRGILDAAALAQLPRGAVVINAARGPHVVDEDLLRALAEGRVGHAVLDVFDTEPLPADHPYWQHPRVTVTPHIASLTNPETGARHVAEGIRRDRIGEPPQHVVDPSRGY